ncbi:DUF1403 family protein [Pararhizobium sp. PWRC1-1]|uniref:DUF1403 family protein n=1 Tax=Pararhizobium sp. PWRC1-1 TaxID=2804566 RepID=UPI003CE8BEEC
MDSRHKPAPSIPIQTPQVPGWATLRGAPSDGDAAFLAGAALNSLDSLVRSEAVWAGAWRQRLGLRSALAALRLMGRSEEEGALRDAVLLPAPGGDPGPAGNVLVAYKKLSSRMISINTKTLHEIADLFALRRDDALEQVPGVIDDVLRDGRTAPFAVARLVTAVCELRPDAEILAWWLADWILAKKLGWQYPVPLLMAERYGAVFRTGTGKGRVRPGDETFERTVCLALVQGVSEALRQATETRRRAEQLLAVAAKVRTKGAETVIRQLLNEDALSASAPGTKLSRWASRRLFERLETLGAVRELSGRSTFRIYGL